MHRFTCLQCHLLKEAMSRYIIALCILLITASCEKNGANSTKSIEGRWKMISIVDNVTNTVQSKPPSITGDVEIQFNFTGSFTGNINDSKTPSNEIYGGDFSVTDDRGLSIGPYGMTKVYETSWGLVFLQEVNNVHTYFFDTPTRLNLKTATNTLVFIKM